LANVVKWVERRHYVFARKWEGMKPISISRGRGVHSDYLLATEREGVSQGGGGKSGG